MHTSRRLSLLTALVAAMGLLLVPGTALAQYVPSGDNYVTCTPDPAEPGDFVDCEAGIFEPDSDVDVRATANGEVVLDDTVTADAEGIAAFGFSVPADAEDGAYEVTVEGTAADGETLVMSEGFEIEAAAAPAPAPTSASDETLTDTGSDSLPLVLAALALLAVGGGAVFLTRRRANASA